MNTCTQLSSSILFSWGPQSLEIAAYLQGGSSHSVNLSGNTLRDLSCASMVILSSIGLIRRINHHTYTRPFPFYSSVYSTDIYSPESSDWRRVVLQQLSQSEFLVLVAIVSPLCFLYSIKKVIEISLWKGCCYCFVVIMRYLRLAHRFGGPRPNGSLWPVVPLLTVPGQHRVSQVGNRRFVCICCYCSCYEATNI